MMKNPATDEIIKTAFKSNVKNNPILQIVIAEKQINNIPSKTTLKVRNSIKFPNIDEW